MVKVVLVGIMLACVACQQTPSQMHTSFKAEMPLEGVLTFGQ